jgi:hypothetical protein
VGRSTVETVSTLSQVPPSRSPAQPAQASGTFAAPHGADRGPSPAQADHLQARCRIATRITSTISLRLRSAADGKGTTARLSARRCCPCASLINRHRTRPDLPFPRAKDAPVPRKGSSCGTSKQGNLSSSEDTRNRSSSSCRVYASGGDSTYLTRIVTSNIGGPALRPSLFLKNVTTCVTRLCRVRSSSPCVMRKLSNACKSCFAI